MKFTEMLEATEREVVIGICGVNGPKFEIVKPAGECSCGWDLHINPDDPSAYEIECHTLEEAAEVMIEELWKRSW